MRRPEGLRCLHVDDPRSTIDPHYEVVRRRLKLIVVCDGTADPTYTFSDLANAVEKVRADFGALIDITSES